jgi:ABC-2 type transport system ATP-binding protein
MTASADSPPLAIEARGVERRFGARKALAGLDLRVGRGEALGLLGPNGAGKTTTIRILCTLVRADAGSVRVLGLDPATDARALRARIGVVPQELAVYDDLSARENLTFFGQMHGLRGAELTARVTEGLDDAGLAERASDRVRGFSGGMKRRLNFVAALLHRPELVFLDEPTVGVDPQSRNRLYDMVERVKARGTTLVYTTHQMGEVERLCDRIAILDHGRVLASGTFDELQRRVAAERKEGARLDVGPRAAEARALLEANGFDVRIDEQLPDLEGVFLTLTGHTLRDEPEGVASGAANRPAEAARHS